MFRPWFILAHQPTPIDLACPHLKSIRQGKTNTDTNQMMERRHGQKREKHVADVDDDDGDDDDSKDTTC